MSDQVGNLEKTDFLTTWLNLYFTDYISHFCPFADATTVKEEWIEAKLVHFPWTPALQNYKLINVKSLEDCTALCEEWSSTAICNVVVYSRDTMTCQYDNMFSMSEYKTFRSDKKTRVAFKFCGKYWVASLQNEQCGISANSRDTAQV